MKNYLLFDLDGTLTDPKLGITTCVQYALKAYGIDEPDLDKLEPFIGPPLADSFMEFYGMDLDTAKAAIEKYRERFSTVGLFENEVYQGIPHMLASLKLKGVHMGIASSKPTVFVQKILEHFGLDAFFEVVVGSELDGTRGRKEEVVDEALSRLFKGHEVKREQVYMIGDRKFDVEGARAQGIESVAVAYGYGSLEELMEAHADYIVCTVPQLEEFLLRSDSDERKLPTLNQRIWTIFANCLLFYGAKLLGSFVGGVFLLSLANDSEFFARLFALAQPDGKGLALSPNGSAAASLFGYLLGMLLLYRTIRFSVKKTKKEHFLSHLIRIPLWQYVVAFVGSLMLVLGLNGLISITGFANVSASYRQTSAAQYGCSLALGILCYCIAAPLAEEFLFRGILYGYCRRCLGIFQGMLLTSVLFGALHFNPVQGIYAAVMGFVFVYLYEYFGAFWVPAALHIAANLLSYLLTWIGWFEQFSANLVMVLLTFFVGAGCIGYLLYQKKRLLTL